MLKSATDVVDAPVTGVGKAVQGVDDAVQDLGKGVVKGIQRLLRGKPTEDTAKPEKIAAAA